MDRETAKEKLSVSHGSDCENHNIITSDEAATMEEKMTLEKECQSCGAKDHLMYDYDTERDASEVVEFDVGDAIVSNGETWWGVPDKELNVTAIADGFSPMSDTVYVCLRFPDWKKTHTWKVGAEVVQTAIDCGNARICEDD